MGFRETPRNDFEITVRVRWYLDVEETAELLRAMAAAPAEIFFTSEEFNRVVDWIARERKMQTDVALNAMSAVGGGAQVEIEPRKPELLSVALTKRLATALSPVARSDGEETTRKLLRDIFRATVDGLDRMGAI